MSNVWQQAGQNETNKPEIDSISLCRETLFSRVCPFYFILSSLLLLFSIYMLALKLVWHHIRPNTTCYRKIFSCTTFTSSSRFERAKKKSLHVRCFKFCFLLSIRLLPQNGMNLCYVLLFIPFCIKLKKEYVRWCANKLYWVRMQRQRRRRRRYQRIRHQHRKRNQMK